MIPLFHPALLPLLPGEAAHWPGEADGSPSQRPSLSGSFSFERAEHGSFLGRVIFGRHTFVRVSGLVGVPMGTPGHQPALTDGAKTLNAAPSVSPPGTRTIAGGLMNFGRLFTAGSAFRSLVKDPAKSSSGLFKSFFRFLSLPTHEVSNSKGFPEACAEKLSIWGRK